MKSQIKIVLVILVLMILGGTVWGINEGMTYRTKNHDVKEGRSRLEEMGETSVEDAKKKVDAAWATPTPAAQPQVSSAAVPGLYREGTTYSPEGVLPDEQCTMWRTHPLKTGKLKKLLEDSVILGDSMVEAIDDFSILYPDEIVFLRGVCVNNTKDLVKKTIRLKPERVFTIFGINDMNYYQKDAKQFAKDYHKMLENLQKHLPGVQLYVCAITPIREHAVNKEPALARVDRYNRELIAMCRKYQIPFVNSTPILTGKEDYYEPDGIHPGYQYYPKWLTMLVQKAGLL